MNTDLVLNTLRSEWGTGRIAAVCHFGSTASSAASSRYSDHDLAVVVEGESAVAERDAVSRAIKKKLRAAGDVHLYGFNFFPRRAFEAMASERSWLAATIARTHSVLYDPDGLFRLLPDVQETVPFGWRDVAAPPAAAYERLIELHEAAAAILADDVLASGWYSSEVFRLRLLARCRNAGLYLSRASILDAAHALERNLHTPIENYEEVHRQNYLQLTAGEFFRDHPDHTERHLEASARLRVHGLTLLALRHAYNAARLQYLRHLHCGHFYMLDGEVTHAFLVRHERELPPELVTTIERVSLLAEQVLGRLGIASFDVDENGEGIYEQLSRSPESVYSSLLASLPTIANRLRRLPTPLPPPSPSVSLVILTHQRVESLGRTLAAVDRLVIPENQMEVVVVHDGELDPAPHRMVFPTLTLGKPHTGVGGSRAFGVAHSRGKYLLFLDDDVVPSPTWALRLLQVAESGLALTGSTILSMPPASLIERYCDDRELLRTPVAAADGSIANVITASACLRRDALKRIGQMGESLVRRGVRFGGDDVDLTWAVLAAGLRVAHAAKAVTFHQHRGSLRALVCQHVGYGHGTMVHCIERQRPSADLRIADPTIRGVVTDILRYATLEVPARLRRALRRRRIEPLAYPILDLVRRCAYDAGILLAMREENRRND